MASNAVPLKKKSSIEPSGSQDVVSPFAIQDLEKTIDPHNFLENKDMCRCNLCAKEEIVD